MIEYNREKDYNEANNPNYLPPYRSEFPSIYKGVTVEIQIVDHCNLNCNCCNHFSPLADKWFMELESFETQIKLLKEKIPTLKVLFILGGEPTLHPHLFEICKSAREILGPEIFISVLSNGTIIKPIAEHKQEYLDLDIDFSFTSYPFKTKNEEIQSLAPLGNMNNTRILSRQTLVEPKGFYSKEDNFYNCRNHKLPCLTIKDSKLYICPFCAHVEHYCKKANCSIEEVEGIDYLDLAKMTSLDELQTFCFTPKNYCSYCRQNVDAYAFDESKKDLKEYTCGLRELYAKDYERYESLINAGKDNIPWALDPEKNLAKIDYNFHYHALQTEMLRYGLGKFDIIIPYYGESIEQFKALKENLLSQTIIQDCVIYLVSDHSHMDLGVVKLFANTIDLYCVFLKNNTEHCGPGAARNKGIENSYNKNVLFLDADDAFAHPKVLENLYADTLGHEEVVSFRCYQKDGIGNKTSYVINRKYLRNLRHENYPFGEDRAFEIKLLSIVPDHKIKAYSNTKNEFMVYNATKGNNITTSFYGYDPRHFSLLTANYLAFKEVLSSNLIHNEGLILNYLYAFCELFEDFAINQNLINDTFFCSLIIYIMKSIDKNRTILHSYQIRNLNNKLNLHIDEVNMEEIKEYLLTIISIKYLKDKKLKYNAEKMLKDIEDF